MELVMVDQSILELARQLKGQENDPAKLAESLLGLGEKGDQVLEVMFGLKNGKSGRDL
jgi:lipoate synthase